MSTSTWRLSDTFMSDLDRKLDEARYGATNILYDSDPFRKPVKFAGSQTCSKIRNMEREWNRSSDSFHRQVTRSREASYNTFTPQPKQPSLPFPIFEPVAERGHQPASKSHEYRPDNKSDQHRPASKSPAHFDEEYWKKQHYMDCTIVALGLELQVDKYDGSDYVQNGGRRVELNKYLTPKEFYVTSNIWNTLLDVSDHNTQCKAKSEAIAPSVTVKRIISSVADNIGQDLMINGSMGAYDAMLTAVSAFIDAVDTIESNNRSDIDACIRETMSQIPVMRELEILQRIISISGHMNIKIIKESEQTYLKQGMSARVARARALYDNDFMGDTDASFVAHIINDEKS